MQEIAHLNDSSVWKKRKTSDGHEKTRELRPRAFFFKSLFRLLLHEEHFLTP